MSAYPAPFDPARFPGIPDAVKPRQGNVSPKLIAYAAVEVRSALRVTTGGDAEVTALWIESRKDPSARSQSFQNGEPAKNPAIDPGKHFHFLPGVDDVQVRWTVTRPGKVAGARFELYSAVSAAPIWTKEYDGGAAIKLLEGPDGAGSGPLAWSEVTITGDAVNFPDQIPTVAAAPYQLRLTLTGEAGGVTTAWSYFDVLVQAVELHWGDPALVPAGAIQDVLPIFQPLTDRDERALLAGLRAGGTRIDGARAVEIALRSTNAAYVHLNEWYMWRDFAFLRFKARWGAGPRIPLVAKITLKSLEQPGGVHSAAAAPALGPAEFLWDWRDKDEAARQHEMAAYDARASAFVMRGLKYKENAAGEPPACLNCHADRGGKRGGAERVLPEFSSPAVFPYAVARPATRSWGALSKALTGGTHACTTGVLFQPSRMALDSYQLRVFLVTPANRATLDAAGTMDALVTAHPGLPTAHTGMMEMRRQVDAQYIRKGTTTPRADLNAVAAEYGKGGIKVVWTEPFWTRAEYNNLMAAAIAPDNAAEDLGHVRNRVYEKNAKARRSGLQAWKISSGSTVDSPVKGQLAHYDQWFGCKAGQVAGSESAAQFTLPGRELVEALYIDPVVDEYIRKDRVSNDKKRKWNKFKTQNPTVADPELRVRFYHELLTKAERDKLLPEIERRFTADGWNGWSIPRDRPEEWAAANYQYRISKLVYLSEEMHLRKVLADGFEGVTVFHYQHFIDTLNPDGSIYARQCAIGGVAAISMIADLGLSGAFTVWDHPTNMQRQTMSRMLCARLGTAPQGPDGHTGDRHSECTFKDGNSTIVHEFGHFLHLPHARPTGGADEARMHDQADAKCIMNYDPDALHLCGGCLLRLRGWAFFQSKGQQGFSNTTPDAAGVAPPDPTTAGLPALFTRFYADFV